MLNDKLLEDFMNGFYGFGNYKAPYWFIGMEEGGRAELPHITKQLQVWDKSKRKELLDVIDFAHEMGFSHLTKWYGNRPALQKTWKNLIRILLLAEKQPADNENIREYQKESWGTKNGISCLMELLPLPSRNRNLWLYSKISLLPYLSNRQIYENHIVGSRIAHFQTAIKKYKPRVVVFYGKGFDEYWKNIVGINSWRQSEDEINFTKMNGTLFVFSNHPQCRGIKDEYFCKIGNFIKDELSIN